MLQNAYLLAKIGVDTAENERKFADNLPQICNYRRRRRRRRRRRGALRLRRRAAAGARKRKLMPGGPVSAAGIASHESSQIFDKTCSVFRQLFSRNLARRARGGTNSEIFRGTFNEMLHNLLSFLKVDKIAFQII